MNIRKMGRVCLLLLAVACLFSYGIGTILDGGSIDHDCRGEDCLFCLCSLIAERVAGIFLTVLFASFFGILFAFFKTVNYCTAELVVSVRTPILLKVKLSN